MLELDGLRWRAGDFALEAEMQIAPGDRVAVIGPSGAGKSTLLDLVAGFRSPEVGRVLWQGRDLGPLSPAARPVTILFQDNNLFPHLSIARNLGLAVRPDGRRPDAAQTGRIGDALARVGLSGFEDRLPGSLSGGQQSRAALARVLVQDRPVLLLDEPFAALGPALRAEMLDLVAEVTADTGALVLLVSHDPKDALRFAPQAIVVAEGRAHAPADTATLLDDPPPALRAYLGH
ncbi:thiamine ABC transporter ATP-binding protein [Thalassococcus profundi]|nr:ATP-binding cassette domain-containing protein [Thalassococcus profundi]